MLSWNLDRASCETLDVILDEVLDRANDIYAFQEIGQHFEKYECKFPGSRVVYSTSRTEALVVSPSLVSMIHDVSSWNGGVAVRLWDETESTGASQRNGVVVSSCYFPQVGLGMEKYVEAIHDAETKLHQLILPKDQLLLACDANTTLQQCEPLTGDLAWNASAND